MCKHTLLPRRISLIYFWVESFVYCRYKCNYNMHYEWDEAKRLANIRKHGIDFVDCPAIFAGYTVTVLDDRIDYDEERFVTLGLLHDRVVVVAHTETADTIRVISIRKATKREQAYYFEIVRNGLQAH